MLLAAFGAIHGNLPALEAILCAVDEQGINTVMATGDVVGRFPWPGEVVELLRSRGIIQVQGCDDRLAARFLRKRATHAKRLPSDEFAAFEWTYENTGSEDLEYLAGLPKSRPLSYEGLSVVLCHGTPGGQTEELTEESDIGLFRRQREIANSDIIVFGHTPEPFSLDVDGTLFVNPGAAVSGANARYAVIDTETQPWSVTHHEVEYDAALVAEQMKRRGFPGV